MEGSYKYQDIGEKVSLLPIHLVVAVIDFFGSLQVIPRGGLPPKQLQITPRELSLNKRLWLMVYIPSGINVAATVRGHGTTFRRREIEHLDTPSWDTRLHTPSGGRSNVPH